MILPLKIAPGAFVIATKYDTDVDLIASSMVACTFISGPIIFISSKMISLTNLQPSDFFPQLEIFSFDISVVGILMSVATLTMFIVTKKHRKMPHKVTCCLLISQIIVCIGVILWSCLELKSPPAFYTQFVFYTFGCISSRIWCAISAITLLFIQYRSLCFVLKMTPIFVRRKKLNVFSFLSPLNRYEVDVKWFYFDIFNIDGSWLGHSSDYYCLLVNI